MKWFCCVFLYVVDCTCIDCCMKLTKSMKQIACFNMRCTLYQTIIKCIPIDQLLISYIIQSLNLPTIINGSIPTLPTKPRITNIIIRDIGIFKCIAMSLHTITRRATEAYMSISFTLVICPTWTVLSIVAIFGCIAPRCTAEVMIGILLCQCYWW